MRHGVQFEDLNMYFPVSGVEVNPLVPVAVSFAISLFTSMGGVSGAFLLLPFQVSVLKFTSPAVSPTNLVFNIVAIPGGVYRYIKEGRMAWPLAWIIILGTLPGVFVGAVVRVNYLPDARSFKLFVGLVMLYIGYRLCADLVRGKAALTRNATGEMAGSAARESGGSRAVGRVATVSLSLREVVYSYNGKTYSFAPAAVLFLSLVIGVVGGIYGIGGGAIIAPFLVTFIGLPVHTIAGVTLLGTFVTSIAGALIYYGMSVWHAESGLAIAPDWLLGFLFGLGGFFGVYCGARLQRFVPEKAIKAGLAVMVLFLALRYIAQYLL